MRREPLRARRLRLLDLLGVALDDAVPPFNFLLVGVRVALAVQEELGRLLQVLAGLRRHGDVASMAYELWPTPSPCVK